MRHSGTAWYGLTRGVTLVALLALGAGCAPLLAQEIYKSVDADGHVVYSDRGATKNAPATSVHVTEPDPVEAARLAKQQQLLNAADKQRQKEEAAEDKVKSQAEHAKQHNCENARNLYYRERDARRIFQKRDADGNAIYYTDDEADAVREKDRRAMLDACGS